MFSQKKRNHKWLLGAVFVILAAVLVFWAITWARSQGDGEQQVIQPETVANADTDAAGQKNENKESPEFYSSYYLVKYDNHVIKIFFSDETGKLTELEDTSIVYETLADTDQNDFLGGIRVNSRDELNKLLMDYES